MNEKDVREFEVKVNAILQARAGEIATLEEYIGSLAIENMNLKNRIAELERQSNSAPAED